MARYALSTLLVGIILTGAPGTRAGDTKTILLRSGPQIRAEIVKQDDQAIILDLGYDLLRIPRSQIETINEDVPVAPQVTVAAVTTAEPGEPTPDAEGLYRTARLGKTTIEKNVARFGEAVVMVATPTATGSGFLINEDGYLITNYHVIARETFIRVTVFQRGDNGFEPKRYEKVRIVAFNPYVDLALLKIEEAGRQFPYLFLGNMSRVSVGETVFAIGNPLGLTRTVSQGIVSSTSRDFEGRLYIQTTTDINPGNSGGPLFNLAGEVIGVTSMGYLFYGGLNFAIPVDAVKRFVESWDAFAYREDNPNAGFRYLQPGGRTSREKPPVARPPEMR
jgi:serine protease Do